MKAPRCQVSAKDLCGVTAKDLTRNFVQIQQKEIAYLLDMLYQIVHAENCDTVLPWTNTWWSGTRTPRMNLAVLFCSMQVCDQTPTFVILWLDDGMA